MKSTAERLQRRSTSVECGQNRGGWTASLLIALTLGLSACSSGGSDPADEEPVDTTTNSQPPDSTPTAVETLMQEIKLTAAAPLLTVNRKLTGGESLTTEEKQCLGDFDAALGEAATALDCETPLLVTDSIIIVGTSEFEDTDSCQGSINQNSVEACTLHKADILIPIEWVAGLNKESLRMGTPHPIAGAKINYNLDDDGKLVLSESADLTGTFNCVIDITSATLEDTGNQAVDCSREIERISERLTLLRPVELVINVLEQQD